MKVNLFSTNHKKFHGNLDLVVYENKVLVIHESEVVATLSLQTMENDNREPTENFWVYFNATNPQPDYQYTAVHRP